MRLFSAGFYCLISLFYKSSSSKFPLNGDYVSWFGGRKFQPVKPGYISHYDYMKEIRFHSGKVGQFFIWYLFTFVYIFLVFFCKHALSYFFIPPWKMRRLHGKISSGRSGIPAVQMRNPASPGQNFSHVIAGYNLWRICNTAAIPTKRDNFMPVNRDHIITTLVFVKQLSVYNFL